MTIYLYLNVAPVKNPEKLWDSPSSSNENPITFKFWIYYKFVVSLTIKNGYAKH